MKRALFCLIFAFCVSSDGASSKAPWSPFTPRTNAYARRLVSEQFELAQTPEQIDPQVRGAFYRIVPRRELAVGSQAFAITDVSDGRSRRFDFAGRSGDLWFVLYEFGGRAYHHSLIVFQRRGGQWQEAGAAVGFLDHKDYRSFLRAIKTGKFHEVSDRLNL